MERSAVAPDPAGALATPRDHRSPRIRRKVSSYPGEVVQTSCVVGNGRSQTPPGACLKPRRAERLLRRNDGFPAVVFTVECEWLGRMERRHSFPPSSAPEIGPARLVV